MKTHVLIILFVFHFFCLTGCEKKKKNELKLDDIKISKIIIHYQCLDVETPIRIDCEEFNNYFNKGIKTIVIDDSKIINKLVNYLNEAKVNNKRASQIDVRFKMIIIYSNGTIKEFCGNESVIEIDKSNYQINVKFSNYIKSILK